MEFSRSWGLWLNMLHSAQSVLRRLVSETRASEIAEAAAVLPVMFLVMMGIFWFGQAFSLYGTITRAAQDGARAGAAPRCTTCTTLSAGQRASNAEAAVQAAMTIAKLNPNAAQQPSPVPSFTICGTGVTSCDGGSTKVCVQNPVQLKASDANGPAVCGIAVTFQYPFQFTLPFTSLNNQKIWMTAAARVRLETQ